MTAHVIKNKAWYAGGGSVGVLIATFYLLGVTPEVLTSLPETKTSVQDHHERIIKIEKDLEFGQDDDINLLAAIQANTKAINKLTTKMERVITLQEEIQKDIERLRK